MADIREFKTAAKAAAEYLSRDGIEVSQSKMLEALARGFGGRNWVAFRESIAELTLPGEDDPCSQLAGTLSLLIEALEAEDSKVYEGFPTPQARSAAQGNEKTRALFDAFMARNKAKQAEQWADLVSQNPDLLDYLHTKTVSGRISSSPRREVAKAQGRVWLDILQGHLKKGFGPCSTAEQVKRDRLSTQVATLKAFLGPILCPHHPLDEPWQSTMAEKALSSVLSRYGANARLAHVHAFLNEEANSRPQSGIELDNTAASLRVVARKMADHLAPYATTQDSFWYDRPLVYSATGSDEAASANSTEAGKRRRLDFLNVPRSECSIFAVSPDGREKEYDALVDYNTGEIVGTTLIDCIAGNTQVTGAIPADNGGHPLSFYLEMTRTNDADTRYRLTPDRDGKTFRFSRRQDFDRFLKSYDWLIGAHSPEKKTLLKAPPVQVCGSLVVGRMDRTQSRVPATMSLRTGEVGILWAPEVELLPDGPYEWEKFVFEDKDGDEFVFEVFVDGEDEGRFVASHRVEFARQLMATR
jgi:hypothetical protein